MRCKIIKKLNERYNYIQQLSEKKGVHVFLGYDEVTGSKVIIKEISKNEYNPKVIIRTVIGRRNAPLYTGSTHTQDYTEAIRKMVNFPVIKLTDSCHILRAYEQAYNSELSHIMVEERDLYDEHEQI